MDFHRKATWKSNSSQNYVCEEVIWSSTFENEEGSIENIIKSQSIK